MTRTLRIASTTESLSLCWNALDNVEARKYTDMRCLFYSKPLLESDILEMKCLQ